MDFGRASFGAFLVVVALVAAVVPSAASQAANSVAPAAAGSSWSSQEITVSATNDLKYEPAAAYNWKRREYLVVWRNAAGVYGQRITSQGDLIGPSPFPIATGPKTRREPVVDYDPVNDRYFVVWMQAVNGDESNWDLSGRFIPWEGSTPTLPEFKVTDWPGSEWHPSLAYSRGKEEYLVALVYHPGSTTPAYIAGVRVISDGSGFGGSVTISSGSAVCDFPDVVYSGVTRNEYLATWSVWGGSTGWDVHAVRLDNAGSPLGGGEFPVATATQDDAYPAAAACNDADQYLVVWERVFSSSDHGVYGHFFTGTGGADGSEFAIADTTAQEILPDVACTRVGEHYLAMWQQEYAGGDHGI